MWLFGHGKIEFVFSQLSLVINCTLLIIFDEYLHNKLWECESRTMIERGITKVSSSRLFGSLEYFYWIVLMRKYPLLFEAKCMQKFLGRNFFKGGWVWYSNFFLLPYLLSTKFLACIFCMSSFTWKGWNERPCGFPCAFKGSLKDPEVGL